MDIALGLLFAILWSSASIAGKIGLHDAPPLTVLDARFFIAGALLLSYNYVLLRQTPRPKGRQWLHLLVLALTNSTIYLGLAWLALREVSAGIFNLFVASNPFIVALLSSLWLKRSVSRKEWLGMIVSALGLLTATLPSLGTSQASAHGILLTVVSVTTYAFGSVYFKWARLKLPNLVINSWQISFGAFLLLPFAILLNGPTLPQITSNLVGALAWSVLAVSIAAVLIWFYLLKKDPLRASMWMFLTPVFGYLQAALILGEPIHVFDVIGTALVMLGLALSGTIDVRQLPFFRARTRASLPAAESSAPR